MLIYEFERVMYNDYDIIGFVANKAKSRQDGSLLRIGGPCDIRNSNINQLKVAQVMRFVMIIGWNVSEIVLIRFHFS